MKNTHLPTIAVATVALALSSCGSLAPTASVRDDVYFLPSQAPVTASLGSAIMEEPTAPTPTDDYYDANTSQQLGADRGYYDMTYNDPYYYNYGRFGFGTGVSGWRSGWSGTGWGMGMGWGNSFGGYGYGMSSPWANPYNSYGNYGYGGYGYGGYNGWNSPWGGPFCGSYNPYGYGYGNVGYGYGGYNTPYGNCYGCYSPVVTGDGGSGIIVGHRPSTRGGGMVSNGTIRRPLRNTVGLMPMPGATVNDGRRQSGMRSSTQPVAPVQGSSAGRNTRTINERRPATDQNRSAPGRNVFDSGRTSPSPSNGGSNGGSRGSGGGGGGTRISPGRR